MHNTLDIWLTMYLVSWKDGLTTLVGSRSNKAMRKACPRLLSEVRDYPPEVK